MATEKEILKAAADNAMYIVQLENKNERLQEALEFVLDEYLFMTGKMTKFSPSKQHLRGELERQNDFQLPDLVKRIIDVGLEQALKKGG